MLDNKQISEIFQEIANILEIKGEDKFRVISYNRAAETIGTYPYDLYELWLKDRNNLLKVPGIGKSLAQKIEEMLVTGRLEFHEKLLSTFPKGLLEMLKLRGLGPKKVKLLYDELGIDTLEMLKEQAIAEKIQALPHMGKKTEESILIALEEYNKFSQRTLLPFALISAMKYIEYLKKCPEIKRVEYAGSLRRRQETIGDIDILATGKNHKGIINFFIKYQEIEKIIASGDTKASIILKQGMQVDLRVLNEEEFGAALMYFTGSKEHNIVIRERAKKMGLKISEYGIFKGEKMIGGKTEEEMYEKIGLPYIEPELRECRGEIEVALNKKLPNLINIDDLKGDLHVHSIWSDGSEEIKDIATKAIERGFSYIAITDHSKSLHVAKGLNKARIFSQMEEIDKLNKGFKNFKIYKGSEVDILENGDLDFDKEILSKLDIVIGSLHSKFNLSKIDETNRIVKALENPYLTILGHPTGRLLLKRKAVDLDMEKIIDAAKKNKKVLEINSNPQRLDLNDFYCKLAKDKGVKLAINSDSHHSLEFDNLIYGIFQARRGWIEKKDVINTEDILKIK